MTQPDSKPKPTVHSALSDGLETVLSRSADTADGSLTHRTTSMSWPGRRIEDSLVPVAGGSLQPELIKLGKRSSLMAAIAVGISSVRHSNNAEELFSALHNANKEPLSTTDRTKDVHKRIQAVRDFKLPLLRGITIRPLVDNDTRKVQGPLPGTFDAINQGSAVIFPLPQNIIREKPRGRQLWSVITGFQEKLVPDNAPDGRSISGSHLETDFAVAIALRDIGALAMMGEEQFDALLGDAPYAYIISSTDRA